jgi:isopentenyl-diphosphate delta-isomerase type 1
MDQHTMMETDQLIAVDENDRIVASETGAAAGNDGVAVVVTKKDGHRFNAESPRGVLHRAFSVFVFDQHGRLMLTRRAAAKITFPNVWTNACCSHPLHGMTPNEVDDTNTDAKEEDEVRTEGIKNAVVRKLQHELGIAPDSIDKDRLVFVKRFHYWASDTITYGNDSPWGEHEIDYIFFYQAPVVVASTGEDKDEPSETTTTTTTTHTMPPTLVIRPNPEEVAACEFVTKAELVRRMRQHEQGGSTAEGEEEVLWSPWFVGIMERGGFDWCDDLDRTLQGRYTSGDITYFDPPARHVAAYNLPHHGRTTGVAATATATTTAAATKSSPDSR